jgi:hypothetical protein
VRRAGERALRATWGRLAEPGSGVLEHGRAVRGPFQSGAMAPSCRRSWSARSPACLVTTICVDSAAVAMRAPRAAMTSSSRLVSGSSGTSRSGAPAEPRGGQARRAAARVFGPSSRRPTTPTASARRRATVGRARRSRREPGATGPGTGSSCRMRSRPAPPSGRRAATTRPAATGRPPPTTRRECERMRRLGDPTAAVTPRRPTSRSRCGCADRPGRGRGSPVRAADAATGTPCAPRRRRRQAPQTHAPP